MKPHIITSVALVTATLVVAVPLGRAQHLVHRTPIEAVRQELLHLPSYGVFDFLTFSYEKGTVTLEGYAYNLTLKEDAEQAVTRTVGVARLIDHVEDLPASLTDEDLRWKVYYAIFSDPSLARYAPGGALLWGHRHPFPSGGDLLMYGPMPFPGSEPAGHYPIHIIVKTGHITLLGVVDRDTDKWQADRLTRDVSGCFSVENDLTVESLPY